LSASVLLLLLRHLHSLHRDAFAHCAETLACARRLRDRGILLRLQHWSVRIVEAGHHQKPAYHQDQQRRCRQFSRVLPQRSSASQSGAAVRVSQRKAGGAGILWRTSAPIAPTAIPTAGRKKKPPIANVFKMKAFCTPGMISLANVAASCCEYHAKNS